MMFVAMNAGVMLSYPPKTNMTMENPPFDQNPRWLGYIGDHTTQLHRDYNML